MEKRTGKHIFKYDNGQLSIFEDNDDSLNLIKKVDIVLKDNKDFEMEIIFQTQKLEEEQKEIYGDY
jgi:hypothetical protein